HRLPHHRLRVRVGGVVRQKERAWPPSQTGKAKKGSVHSICGHELTESRSAPPHPAPATYPPPHPLPSVWRAASSGRAAQPAAVLVRRGHGGSFLQGGGGARKCRRPRNSGPSLCCSRREYPAAARNLCKKPQQP